MECCGISTAKLRNRVDLDLAQDGLLDARSPAFGCLANSEWRKHRLLDYLSRIHLRPSDSVSLLSVRTPIAFSR